MGMFSCCSAAPAVKEEAQPHVQEEEAVLNGHGHQVIPCSSPAYGRCTASPNEASMCKLSYHLTHRGRKAECADRICL